MSPEQILSAVSESEEMGVASEAIHLPSWAMGWKIPWLLWWPWVARVAVLLLTDIVALLAAAYLGYLLWASPVQNQPFSLYVGLVPLLGLFPLGYAGAGLYPGFGLGAVETLQRLSNCTSFAFLILAASSFAFKASASYSRITFAFAWGISLIAVPLLRFFVLSVLSRYRWWREPAILVGNERWIPRVIRALENAVSLGYRPVGILSPDVSQHGHTIEGVPVLGGPELAARLATHNVRVAFVGEGERRGPTLDLLQRHFRQVVMVAGYGYGSLPVETVRVRNLGGLLGVEFTNNLLLLHNRFLKRTLDIVLGVVLLLLASPFILLAGILIKLSSRGSVFFSQEREGLGGHPVTVRKLRTMYQDAERRLKEFLSANPEMHREWEEHFKLARDPRVIPLVGVLLRRFSVDELPQLWSVVIGEMSLVGPRPFPEYHLREFPSEFRELRRQVRPGLTGLWQVTVRSNGDLREQEAYDTYYIRNWSIWLDFYLLTRTIFAVLAGRGAC